MSWEPNIYKNYCEELKKLDIHISLPHIGHPIATINSSISPTLQTLGVSSGKIEAGVDNITGIMAKCLILEKDNDEVGAKVKMGINRGTPASYGGFLELAAYREHQREQNLSTIISTSGKSILNYSDRDMRLSLGQDSLNIGGGNFGLQFSTDSVGFQFGWSR